MSKKLRKKTIVQPEDLSSVDLHRLLLTAIAPRPIALASTVDQEGRVNLSPFSYFNVFSTRPPVCIISPSRRVKDNTEKHTLENVREVPEVCINIVNYAMTRQMSLASSDYAKGVNEFGKAGFTEAPCMHIRPPRVDQAPVSLECRVDEVKALGSEGGAGNLIICRILSLHLDDTYLRADGTLSPDKLDLVGRMGEDWYCRADDASMFRVPKPGSPLGMGVEALPERIRLSHVLTGNDLGKLGHLTSLPSPDAIEERRETEKCKSILRRCEGDADRLERELHEEAKRLIEDNHLIEAMEVMMIIK